VLGHLELLVGALEVAEAAEAVGDAQLQAEAALRGAVGGGERALRVRGRVPPPSHTHQHAAARVQRVGGRVAQRHAPRERGRRLHPLAAPLRPQPRNPQLGAQHFLSLWCGARIQRVGVTDDN